MIFEDDNIKQLPVRFKDRNVEASLVKKDPYGGCAHHQILVDDKKAEVECADCGEKINPLWVLSRMATDETRWHRARKRYQDEMKRLKERSRTKCDACGHMTRISRR